MQSLTNTESFVAYVDRFDGMSIASPRVSELFEDILGSDWWYMFEERDFLVPFFEPLAVKFFEAVESLGSEMIKISLDVEYEFFVSGASTQSDDPPGSAIFSFVKVWEDRRVFAVDMGVNRGVGSGYKISYVRPAEAVRCYVRAIKLELLL